MSGAPMQRWNQDLMSPQRSWADRSFPWSTVLNFSLEQVIVLLSRGFNCILSCFLAFNWLILMYLESNSGVSDGFACGASSGSIALVLYLSFSKPCHPQREITQNKTKTNVVWNKECERRNNLEQQVLS